MPGTRYIVYWDAGMCQVGESKVPAIEPVSMAWPEGRWVQKLLRVDWLDCKEKVIMNTKWTYLRKQYGCACVSCLRYDTLRYVPRGIIRVIQHASSCLFLTLTFFSWDLLQRIDNSNLFHHSLSLFKVVKISFKGQKYFLQVFEGL